MKYIKRAALIILTFLSCTVLVSCDAHFGSAHYDVPWWVVSVFIVIIFAIATRCLTFGKYCCPKCGTEFSPKRFDVSAWFSAPNSSDRVLKCPCCKRRGSCRRV